MKLNFDKIKRFEQSHSDVGLSLGTVQTLIEIVLAGDALNPSYGLAVESLRELGILELDQDKKEPQLLKS